MLGLGTISPAAANAS